MNNFSNAFKGSWKFAAATLLFFLFFLLGAETASAQSYVDGPTAIQKLKAESSRVYDQLLLETPGTTTYNEFAARIHYYGTIMTEIEVGKTVAVAIDEAIPGICYPSASADCNPLNRTLVAPIVENTKVLLRN